VTPKRLAILVALILAGLVALDVPNIYTAMQRAKQKRTMVALRTWAEGIDAYVTKHGAAPRAGYAGPVSGIASLVKGPLVDGWGHPLLYHAMANHYLVRSTGRDGENDHLVEGITTGYDDDIVLADGVFSRGGVF